MKIAATADLHGALPDYSEIPESDLLIIAGDISPFKSNHYPDEQLTWFKKEFIPWIEGIDSNVALIGGNHDFFLEDILGKAAVEKFEDTEEGQKFAYLEDRNYPWKIGEEVVRLYGTPWTPNLARWAFQVYDGEIEDKPPRQSFIPPPRWGQEVFRGIPDGLDILISHGPPAGYGDTVSRSHVGGMSLLEAVVRAKPRVMICGHIHEGYGHYRMNDTEIYCVSRMTRDYEPTNPIVEFEIDV